MRRTPLLQEWVFKAQTVPESESARDHPRGFADAPQYGYCRPSAATNVVPNSLVSHHSARDLQEKHPRPQTFAKGIIDLAQLTVCLLPSGWAADVLSTGMPQTMLIASLRARVPQLSSRRSPENITGRTLTF